MKRSENVLWYKLWGRYDGWHLQLSLIFPHCLIGVVWDLTEESYPKMVTLHLLFIRVNLLGGWK